MLRETFGDFAAVVLIGREAADVGVHAVLFGEHGFGEAVEHEAFEEGAGVVGFSGVFAESGGG